MGKVSNVFSLLFLLQSGRKYSVQELARKLEVSERMIRVYKEELEKAGIYIDSIMGPYGGYVLKQNVELHPRMLRYDDALLLDSYIQNEKEKGKKEQLLALQSKIKSFVIEQDVDNKELSLKGETLKKYNLLMKAIKEKRKVRIVYDSYQKGHTERVIEPAEMFLFQKGWCCAAFCELRQDIRHFELKRILTYELLNEFYE